MFHKYFLAMFHIFSFVCFLIYGVKRKQVLIAKPRFYFYFFSFYTFYFLLAILWFVIKVWILNQVYGMGPAQALKEREK